MDGKRRVAARFPGYLAFYDLAADGRMLFSLNDERKGIRGLAAGATEERDLSVLEAADLRGISDDGSVILAVTVGEGGGAKGAIYLRRTDGSPAVRLGDGAAFGMSPDGKWVSGFTSRESARRTFILMPTGPGDTVEVHVPQLPDRGGLVVGWLGGEENYLVQGASTNGKGYQFYDWNARANTLTPASPPNAPDNKPFVSPDRHSYLLPCAINGPWCIYSISGGDPKPVPGLTPHDVPIAWREDGKAIYIGTHQNDNRMMPIYLLDLATGARTLWKELRPSIPVDALSAPEITPDGRAYAYNYIYVRSELYVASGVK
jgi:eukaryotic-like serine/threonine-protein kinase